jgi:hypothetical protein
VQNRSSIVPRPCPVPGGWRSRRAAALLLGALLVPHGAPASVVRALTLAELVEASSIVAVARVETATSLWVDGRIVTDTVLVVDEGLSGAEPDERVTVRTLGGEVEGIGQRVSGEPWLRAGERYLVFLERLPARAGDAAARFRPVGMSQGALPVTEAANGPQVAPNAELPALVVPGRAISVAPWLDVPRPLDEVLVEVRAAVQDAAP